MEGVVAQSSQSPIVRETTARLMQGLRNNDIPGQINRVINFVKQNVTYIRDPYDGEYLITPERLLAGYQGYGFMAGDCDDHVMLLNAMLGSIGIPTKCVGVKFNGSGEFNHVISGIIVNGKMTQVDPCAKGATQQIYFDTLTV